MKTGATMGRCGPSGKSEPLSLDDRLHNAESRTGCEPSVSPEKSRVSLPITNSFRNYSVLLVACGDSLSLVVSAGIAARGGNARTHHQTPANCRRVPIYRARAVRSLREKRPE